MRSKRTTPAGAALILLSAAPLTTAFYLPGVAPTTYQHGDLVPLHVNRLTPSQRDDTVLSVLAYDYYRSAFHFCQPEGGIRDVSESLGSILFGDRIQTSPYILKMGINETCKAVPTCGAQTYTRKDAAFVNARIYENFNINWLIDGLPAGEPMLDHDTDQLFYEPGFSLGYVSEEDGNPVLNNHYDIFIDYHETAENKYRVVGIEVKPSSAANTVDHGSGEARCPEPQDASPVVLSETGGSQVIFSYSVYWQASSTPFATRWDKYLHVYSPKIHWLSLVNSAIIVVFLSGMVFSVLIRLLRKDIHRYNKLNAYAMDDLSNGANGNGHVDDDVQEDSGWKLIHGDVFRPPRHALLLSILAGNGLQIFFMTLFTIVFAILGFLSPSNRGSLGSIMIMLYTFFGFIGGYGSSYVYKALSGEGSEQWKHNLILTPLVLPVITFGTFFLLNLFLWAKESSGAVPFTTMLIIVGIWFVISVPLSFFGSYLAFKRKIPEPPVRTNQIPRQIPDPGYTSSTGMSGGITGFLNRPVPAILLTGLLPFAAIFVELYFIMESIWSAKIFYMFGFLFVCFFLMVLTCATVTVLNVYFLLCVENYHWQWRAFLTGGACALYVFLNAIGFWIGRLSFASFTGAVLYLAYSVLISVLVFVLTGTVGFFASWMFVHRIYSSIRVD